MGYKSLLGKDVAVRILEAFEWADLDPYRAATHNKGIMNGIDAVALATGQDWRAIEAGAHAWASGAGTFSERSSDSSSSSPLSPSSSSLSLPAVAQKRTHGQLQDESSHSVSGSNQPICRGDAYKPLTRYWIEEDEERLRQGFKGQEALVFCGELEMPIMVGTKGGVLSTNPIHAFTLGVMRYPDSKQLAMVRVVCIFLGLFSIFTL
jgi:hydroxymethylglutaryl-CoA reductase